MAKIGRMVKEKMFEELASALKERSNLLIASMGPLKAAEADTLRKQLRGSQSRLVVAKRTLGSLGIASLKADDRLAQLLSGSVAFVLSGDDIVKTAKIVVDFAKANEGKLTVRGGWVEGQVVSEKHVAAIAGLPSKLQLIAEVVGALESPFSSLIWSLEHHLSDLAWVIEEAAKAKPAGAPGAASSG